MIPQGHFTRTQNEVCSVPGVLSGSPSPKKEGWSMIMIAAGRRQPNSVTSCAELPGNFTVMLKDRLRHISKKCFMVT